MLRRCLILLVALILLGVVMGCTQSSHTPGSSGVVATDFQLMGRDIINCLGLNRNACYDQYTSPSYINGH